MRRLGMILMFLLGITEVAYGQNGCEAVLSTNQYGTAIEDLLQVENTNINPLREFFANNRIDPLQRPPDEAPLENKNFILTDLMKPVSDPKTRNQQVRDAEALIAWTRNRLKWELAGRDREVDQFIADIYQHYFLNDSTVGAVPSRLWPGPGATGKSYIADRAAELLPGSIRVFKMQQFSVEELMGMRNRDDGVFTVIVIDEIQRQKSLERLEADATRNYEAAENLPKRKSFARVFWELLGTGRVPFKPKQTIEAYLQYLKYGAERVASMQSSITELKKQLGGKLPKEEKEELTEDLKELESELLEMLSGKSDLVSYIKGIKEEFPFLLGKYSALPALNIAQVLLQAPDEFLAMTESIAERKPDMDYAYFTNAVVYFTYNPESVLAKAKQKAGPNPSLDDNIAALNEFGQNTDEVVQPIIDFFGDSSALRSRLGGLSSVRMVNPPSSEEWKLRLQRALIDGGYNFAKGLQEADIFSQNGEPIRIGFNESVTTHLLEVLVARNADGRSYKELIKALTAQALSDLRTFYGNVEQSERPPFAEMTFNKANNRLEIVLYDSNRRYDGFSNKYAGLPLKLDLQKSDTAVAEKRKLARHNAAIALASMFYNQSIANIVTGERLSIEQLLNDMHNRPESPTHEYLEKTARAVVAGQMALTNSNLDLLFDQRLYDEDIDFVRRIVGKLIDDMVASNELIGFAGSSTTIPGSIFVGKSRLSERILEKLSEAAKNPELVTERRRAMRPAPAPQPAPKPEKPEENSADDTSKPAEEVQVPVEVVSAENLNQSSQLTNLENEIITLLFQDVAKMLDANTLLLDWMASVLENSDQGALSVGQMEDALKRIQAFQEKEYQEKLADWQRSNRSGLFWWRRITGRGRTSGPPPNVNQSPYAITVGHFIHPPGTIYSPEQQAPQDPDSLLPPLADEAMGQDAERRGLRRVLSRIRRALW